MPILQKALRFPNMFVNVVDHEPVEMGITPSVLEHRILFDVQTAADIYWSSRKDDYEYKALGPLRLPYPSIWMEWEIPSAESILIHGKPVDDFPVAGLRCAAHLSEQQLLKDAKDPFRDTSSYNNPNTFDVMTYLEHVNGQIMVWPIAERMTSDAAGNHLARNLVNPLLYPEDSVYQLEKAMGSFNMPAFIALGLINCKNVTTQESGSIAIRRTPKQKRQKQPPFKVRYNTIVLPGGGSTAEGELGDRRHRTNSLHSVRGHFKTFTAEKPLLGQHIGTYWWGWQVRGNAEKGMVVSDYSLEGAKSNA